MSAWLTRIILNAGSRTARRDLGDADALHKRVMSLVPNDLGERARATAGVLYRYDETDQAGPHLLIQTQLPIDSSLLPDQYGSLAVRDLTPLLNLLRADMAVHYRIVGNPTKRLGRTSERSGKLVALRGDEADQWWHNRAHASGLILRTLISTSLPDIRGKGPGRVQHAATRFEGIAVIKDADLARQAVLSGVGRGKAHGCGLLSLAPADLR
ncbi:type I-E CRISPR-associated protein Cas6/Cse3/CasE [Nonomuraea sp. NPDC004702]